MIAHHEVELAYALSLIKTNNITSMFPEWIIHQYPYVETCMVALRGTPCEDGCSYCNEFLNGNRGLNRFFGYEKFRDFDGMPLQEQAVTHALKMILYLLYFPQVEENLLLFKCLLY